MPIDRRRRRYQMAKATSFNAFRTTRSILERSASHELVGRRAAASGRRSAPSLPMNQRVADAVQAFGEHFRVHAHADAKVIRHLEKTPRDRGGVELRAQPLKKNIRISID